MKLSSTAPTIDARHSFLTVAASLDDQEPQPSPRLITIALEAATLGIAKDIDLSHIGARSEAASLVNQWPGEHYRLLTALTRITQPQLAVEVGTFTGLGALALRHGMPEGGRVITYDVLDWRTFPDTVLTADDFGGSLEQRLGDLSDDGFFDSQLKTLRAAGVIFIDGPKDDRFERRFLPRLLSDLRGRGALLVVDDIRFIAMQALWRELDAPKLDITSFGHWSGTGLVEVV